MPSTPSYSCSGWCGSTADECVTGEEEEEEEVEESKGDEESSS